MIKDDQICRFHKKTIGECECLKEGHTKKPIFNNILDKTNMHTLVIYEKAYNTKSFASIGFMLGKTEFKICYDDYRCETDYECAIREGWEECGIEFSEDLQKIFRTSALNKNYRDKIIHGINHMFTFHIPDDINLKFKLIHNDSDSDPHNVRYYCYT